MKTKKQKKAYVSELNEKSHDLFNNKKKVQTTVNNNRFPYFVLEELNSFLHLLLI
jgi:hypothetical protein